MHLEGHFRVSSLGPVGESLVRERRLAFVLIDKTPLGGLYRRIPYREVYRPAVENGKNASSDAAAPPATCIGQVMEAASTVRLNGSYMLNERGGAMIAHFGPMARLSLRSRVTRGQSSASASATYQAS